MKNSVLGIGFLAVFATVVITYPSYADNTLIVFVVVAGMLGLGLVAFVLSSRNGNRDDS